jgi:hypothetical protein
MSERGVRIDVKAMGIGPAMSQQIGHSSKRSAGLGPIHTLEVNESRDSAHDPIDSA